MIGTETPPATVTLLTVNGDARQVTAGSTLAELLASLDLDPRLVVVERNGTILRDRASFDRVVLDNSDTLEIVHFVGGG
ncbi:MAG TPA: sulfur carrier protein ThiS [Gemmatimonadaceae bacterium]|nr:sulfur carrier protein ThiS [Gemmatimonadaceae bacterium]